jgi:Methyltransferase FkbM domain
MTTIDEIVAARGWPEVSLIKVDVQGAKARVLAGARRTLERFRPALFLELDDRQLKRYGSSAAELLASVAELGYAIHTRVGEGISTPMSVDEALAQGATKPYTDTLLLPARAAT